MSTPLILTTGVYDLIKDHVRRKKVSKEQEDLLTDNLRHATQVVRKELPENVVTVDRKVKVKNVTANEELELALVGPARAKVTKKRYSILSDIGLATVGKAVGETVEWPTNEGTTTYQILEVAAL
ncbi:GreA/GreB family elongation factor [Flavobacterium agricola]|uniref:GreA/GreB family elongation factor n=1 Tax=Flavobacterium agricola TaxID=2870839 RepID=A0ABY6LVK9_9FLAO|nr:GreA/GreB family elongation factor [Flavobacterium agricola]UYW00367.1 GreA/GreB family elongation factor [Flavobacterium agricola]